MHEAMHVEAARLLARGLGLPTPTAAPWTPEGPQLQVAARRLRLGSTEGAGFAFDNELQGLETEVGDFTVDATVRRRRDLLPWRRSRDWHDVRLWSAAGNAWRLAQGGAHEDDAVLDPRRPRRRSELPRSRGLVPLGRGLRFWLKLGFISFGGPAGQIAIMHTELVERRRWISERRFLHALNYCMVLPGPEAQQLATYIGWLMHRTWGGIVAGALFVLPSLFILIALSWVYLASATCRWWPGCSTASSRR
jgi:hypothetical protein